MNALVTLLAPIIVPLFLLGLVGSLLVVVLTSIYDFRDVFTKDAPASDDDL